MAEDLDKLWAQSKPVRPSQAEDLDALWEQSKPSSQPSQERVGRSLAGAAMSRLPAQPEAAPEKRGLLERAKRASARVSEANDFRLGDVVNPYGTLLGRGVKTAGILTDELLGQKKAGQVVEDLGTLARRGALFREGDEIDAAGSALVDRVTQGGGRSLVDRYRDTRDASRRTEAEAEKRLPGWAAATAEVAGGLLAPMPPATKVRQAAVIGGVGGGLYGLGGSEADLTRGEFGDAAKDTALGAAIGGGVNTALSGGGVLVRALRDRANKGSASAVAAEQATQEKIAQKAIDTARGQYRSSVQSASRDLEVIERVAQSLPEGNPVGDSARAFLKSPEGRAVVEQVAANKLETAPEAIAKMAGLKNEFQQLAAGKAENVALQTGEALKNPVRKHVLQRAMTLGNRYMPAVAGTIGYGVGGAEGAAIGAALGTVQSLTQGAPGRIIKNMIEKPAVKKAFWDRVVKLSGANPQEAGAIIKTLEAAAAQGEQHLAKTAAALSQKSEAAREILRQVAETETGAGDELAAR